MASTSTRLQPLNMLDRNTDPESAVVKEVRNFNDAFREMRDDAGVVESNRTALIRPRWRRYYLILVGIMFRRNTATWRWSWRRRRLGAMA